MWRLSTTSPITRLKSSRWWEVARGQLNPTAAYRTMDPTFILKIFLTPSTGMSWVSGRSFLTAWGIFMINNQCGGAVVYRKASSRGAYGHDPIWSVFWRASTWFHNNRYYNGTIYIIDNVIVPSDLVESSGYSSKKLLKGSCPYPPLDELLRYWIEPLILDQRVECSIPSMPCTFVPQQDTLSTLLLSTQVYNNNNNNNYIYRALNTGVSKRTGGLSNSVSFIYTCVYSYNNTIKSIYQSTDIHCSLQN